MYEKVEKTPEKIPQMAANAVSQRQNSNTPTPRFVDKRPEAIQMRRLRNLAKDSPQNAKLRDLQHLAAHSVTQKKSNVKQGFGFVDNRPEAITQRKLQEMANNSPQAKQVAQLQLMANKRSQVLTIQHDTTTSTIQRMVSVDLLTDEAHKIKIRAKGNVKDFQGGTSAGTHGWVGVRSYKSRYEITDGTYEDTGSVGPLKNDFTNPEAGHVLAKQNGGDGADTWNIFAQDGGTNNGKYKSFEISMRNDLNKYDDDDKVTFTSYLAGVNIKEGENIADEGLSDAMSISSEDSD